jgi:3-phenylpropionate/trans-cinnamate dioxygenase ferredoxin subunit
MPAREIAAAADIPDGQGKTIHVDGHAIAVFRIGNEFYAIDDACTHADASLGSGEVEAEERCVLCPLHGAKFDLVSGAAKTLPAYEPVKAYPVHETDGKLFVEW